MNLRQWLTGSAAPVTLATAARVAFGVQFAAVAVTVLDPEHSVRLFQLLFVQSIFITFVSGSGFAHAISAATQGHGRDALTRYTRYASMMTALTLTAVTVVPASVTEQLLGVGRTVLALLVLGGASAALNGVLQAIVQPIRSTWHAFGPTACASVVAAILLFVPTVQQFYGLVVVMAAYQFVSLILLWLLNRGALRALTTSHPGLKLAIVDRMGGTAAIGLINCLSILIAYLMREYWTRHVAAPLAEAVFFLWRLSDIYLGIAVTLLAGNPLMQRIRDGNLLFRTRHAVMAVCVAMLGITLAKLGSWPIIGAAILAQVAVESIRLPSAVATIAAVQSGNARRYAMVVLPGPVLAAAGASFLVSWDPFLAVYVYMFVSSGLQLMAYIVVNAVRLRPGRTLLR